MKVIIEIEKDSKLKYEYDKSTNSLVLDRILHNTNSFPYNYGFIPKTLSPDGDPIDVILLCDFKIYPGTICNVKVIGGIDTNDEGGQDDKIICVLEDKIDESSKFINDISDICKTKLKNIKYFLNHYKDGENNKFVNVGNFYNKDTAFEIIKKYSL